MNEKNALNQVMLDAPMNRILFRNNVAQAWSGIVHRITQAGLVRGPHGHVQVFPGDIVIREPRVIHAGLCKGSSDLIGWETIEITADMVGQKIARFVAVEVKTGKVAVTDEQTNFLRQVLAAGGTAELIREKNGGQFLLVTIDPGIISNLKRE